MRVECLALRQPGNMAPGPDSRPAHCARSLNGDHRLGRRSGQARRLGKLGPESVVFLWMAHVFEEETGETGLGQRRPHCFWAAGSVPTGSLT